MIENLLLSVVGGGGGGRRRRHQFTVYFGGGAVRDLQAGRLRAEGAEVLLEGRLRVRGLPESHGPAPGGFEAVLRHADLGPSKISFCEDAEFGAVQKCSNSRKNQCSLARIGLESEL